MKGFIKITRDAHVFWINPMHILQVEKNANGDMAVSLVNGKSIPVADTSEKEALEKFVSYSG